MTYDTPFSFHCMICFEEFHAELRYPVVLPCGHTYVCSVCANRLDKCMECRTPLYTKVPVVAPAQDAQSNADMPSWYRPRNQLTNGRTPNPSPGEHSPQVTVASKKRVPLPKNVVLLSLMEATELASEHVNKQSASGGGSPRSTGGDGDGERPSMVLPMNSMVDIEEEEEEKIKVSTSIAVGAAGTYAVAHKDGLQIHPTRPTDSNSRAIAEFSYSSGHDEDVDTIVMSLDRKIGKAPSPRKSKSPKSPTTENNSDSGLFLSYGDRVQVVALEGGWAKLARGYGYVRVDKNQLVKVGSAVDRACRLEAMLRDLSRRRKNLRDQQTHVDNQFVHLMKDLEISLHNDEDLTVILADTFTAPSRLYDEPEKKEDSPSKSIQSDSDYADFVKPSKREETAVYRPNTSFVCFAGDMFSSGCSDAGPCNAPTLVDMQTSPSQSSLLRVGDSSSPSHANTIFPSSSHPSPSALRAGAQAWRERHGQDARTSIDFRTGMSGHSALLSANPHTAHQYLETQSSTGGNAGSGGGGYGFPKMSSHTGLSMTTKSKPFYAGILSSLTLPSFSAPSADESGEMTRSGSM